MHLNLSFDLGEGAGCCTVQIEDLEPTRLSADGRALLRRLLELCVEHQFTTLEGGEQL